MLFPPKTHVMRSRKLLIGFSGPSGSGKTTLVRKLARMLSERGYAVGMVEEIVRTVFKQYSILHGFKTLKNVRKSSQLALFQLDILKEQVKKEDELLKDNDVVLTDRTIYDNLFFTIPAIYDCPDYTILEEYVNTLKKREKERKYDLIFYCAPIPSHVAPGLDDGFRSAELQYRRFQEFVIRRLIPNDLVVVHVPFCSLTKRLNFCLSVIKHSLE